jgi:hypothetical protein
VICNAIIDTVILLVILGFGLKLGKIIQTNGEKYSDLGRVMSQITVVLVLILAYKTYEMPAACFFVGRSDLVNLNSSVTPASYGDFIRAFGQVVNQINATAIQNATGDTLAAYQQLALAVFRRPPNIYAWTFLIIIAIPSIGLVQLVHRNLDAIAELASSGAGALKVAPAAPPESFTAAPEPQQGIRASESGQGLMLRDIVDKFVRLKALVDSGAISNVDFENQKRRILSQPTNESRAATEPEDFLRFKSLLDSGLITEEEYEGHKQRFLGQI